MNCVMDAWAKYEPELRGFIFNNIADARHSEDILQDTFVKAIHQGSKFCSLENPRAWLFAVTRNQIIDYQRKLKNHNELDDNLVHEEISIDAVESLSACLPQALAELSSDNKIILQMCDIDGQSQKDFAQQNNLSLPATKSRIQRARKKLKEKLKSLCNVQYDDTGNVCCYAKCNDGKCL